METSTEFLFENHPKKLMLEHLNFGVELPLLLDVSSLFSDTISYSWFYSPVTIFNFIICSSHVFLLKSHCLVQIQFPKVSDCHKHV